MDRCPQSGPAKAWSERARLDRGPAIFGALGWPNNTSAAALDYIAARLIESGSRGAAHEMLRRDHHARALLDLDRDSWSTMLRVVLGNQSPDHACTSEGHGLLLRQLIGERVPELLNDDALVCAIAMSAPRKARKSHV